MAARNLGIYGRLKEKDGDFYFEWFDPMAGTHWRCEPSVSKYTALQIACDSLVNYLSVKR